MSAVKFQTHDQYLKLFPPKNKMIDPIDPYLTDIDDKCVLTNVEKNKTMMFSQFNVLILFKCLNNIKNIYVIFVVFRV